MCSWLCVDICSFRLVHRQIGLVARLRQKWTKQGKQSCLAPETESEVENVTGEVVH